VRSSMSVCTVEHPQMSTLHGSASFDRVCMKFMRQLDARPGKPAPAGLYLIHEWVQDVFSWKICWKVSSLFCSLKLRKKSTLKVALA